MQNDIIYTVNPVYATVMSPYGIGSELVFALGVGDQSFQVRVCVCVCVRLYVCVGGRSCKVRVCVCVCVWLYV
jgi:hypothetical protein